MKYEYETLQMKYKTLQEETPPTTTSTASSLSFLFFQFFVFYYKFEYYYGLIGEIAKSVREIKYMNMILT